MKSLLIISKTNKKENFKRDILNKKTVYYSEILGIPIVSSLVKYLTNLKTKKDYFIYKKLIYS